MKKIITTIILFFIFIVSISSVDAYASEATVEIKIKGQVKKESNIEMLVNVKDVKDMYAASVNFTYDTKQLKVNSIKGTDFITKHSNDIMELGGETDKNGNIANYSFTFLGDKKGLSGTNTFVKIEATVLNNEPLVIDSDNMEIKLVQRLGEDVVNYPFTFSGFTSKIENELEVDSNSSSQNNNTDKETVNNNSNDNNSGQNESESNNNSSTIFNDNSDIANNSESTNEEENNEESEKSSNDNTSIVTVEDLDEKNNNVKPDNNLTVLNKKMISTTNKGLIIVGIIIVVFIGGVIGYFKYKKNKVK